MKNPFNRRTVSTGIATPILIFLSAYLKGTRFGWIALPFFMPGLYLATFVYPGGVHSDQKQSYIQLAITLNVAITWAALEVAAVLYGRLINRKGASRI
jgi:hypothetical protein